MIYIEPTAGLGNRLRAVLSAYQIAMQYEQELCIVWNEDSALGARFEDLFHNPKGIKVIEVSNRSVKKDPVRRILGDWKKKKLIARCVQIPVYDDGCAPETYVPMHALLQECVEKQKDIYISAWCQFEKLTQIPQKFREIFVPCAQVEERGRSVFEQIDGHTYGVHIRRTDHADAIAHSPLQAFVERMREVMEQDEHATFYCATDDETVKTFLQERIAVERLFFYENKDYSRQSKCGGQDALVEMLALSRCCKILGSYESSYSQLAAAIGDVELEVIEKR